ncbi:NAD(P)-binding domain-containing protein [Dactylosporangium fulvum]|uniref:NADPH-dependent F420 reductase n=1 Tax=Dactylosporangium fulvum TaxID=53359 RepID=A0ABY5WCP0_9ACTN|nr:NADPH-dependent F420 reductase [Dactylosporangium fulvum]UWP86819.1 NADPH-dependent F420 reductase [Dactylosporangium fulvum]
MKISVIGAGKIGSTLAHLYTAAGDDVAIANSRSPDTLRDLEHQLGRHAHAVTAEEAARYGDIVIVAVPFGHYRDLPAEALAGRTVIDATNYHPERDGHDDELEHGDVTSSELLQRHLAGAHVVKAFNAMRWDHLRDHGRSAGANRRYGIPVSGDDPDAKWQVFDLVEQIGFEPVDAGPLAEGGRKHQPGTEVYTADLWADTLRARIGIEGT